MPHKKRSHGHHKNTKEEKEKGQAPSPLPAHHGSRFWDDSSSAVSCYGKVPTSPPPAVTEMHNETQDESVGSAEKQAESVGDREPQKKVAAHQQDSNLFLN